MRTALPLVAALVVASLGLGACRPSATPVPNPSATATAALTATAAPAPSSTLALPQPELDASWTEHATEEFVIRLPVRWRADEAGSSRAAAALPRFEQGNPDLAGFMGNAGSLATVAFSAWNESSAGGVFADNLNIRRTASGGRDKTGLPEIAAAIADQYRQLGFDVSEIEPHVEDGSLPAARIVYDFPAADRDGKTVSLSGLQMLVIGSEDLWILTYTTRSDRFATLRPVFDESARSFRIK